MEKLFNLTAIIGGVVGGFLVALFGGFDVMMKTIVLFAILDYFTGVVKSIYKKELSSEIGFKGLVKKVMVFVVIAVANIMQQFTGNIAPIREVVIMFFICNEALSILENAAEFINIPPQLRAILLQLRDKNNDDLQDAQDAAENKTDKKGG